MNAAKDYESAPGNCVMDERLDKSLSGTLVNPRSSVVLKKTMQREWFN